MADLDGVARSRRAIRTLFGVLLAAAISTSIATASAGVKRAEGQYPPHRAGMQISAGGAECTSGFGVVDTATSSYFALTAGHCGAHGRVKINGEQVGSLVGSSFLCCRVTDSDSSLYSVPSDEISATVMKTISNSPFGGGSASIGSPLASPTVSVIPVAGYLDNSEIRRRLPVCTAGAYGGYACGEVTDTRYRYRFRSGRTLTRLVCFDTPVSDGDSGGPVFALMHGEAIAVGIVSIGDGAETCFSTIENALRTWEVDLLVAAGNGFRPAGSGTELPDDFRNSPRRGRGPASVPWDDALRDFGFAPPTMP